MTRDPVLISLLACLAVSSLLCAQQASGHDFQKALKIERDGWIARL